MQFAPDLSSDEDELHGSHHGRGAQANAAFLLVNEDWEYKSPNDCIVRQEISKLARIKRTSDLIPAYKKVFHEIKFHNSWDGDSRRSFLRSLFNHHLLRKEDLTALVDLILPVAANNIDLVTDLVFRCVYFYRYLHSNLQKHPRVAMAFLHYTSSVPECNYARSVFLESDGSREALCFPDYFPWQLLTFEVFLKQYLDIPKVSPPTWLCNGIKQNFSSLLVHERGEIQWVAWTLIKLARLIATDRRDLRTRFERIHLLLLTITSALDELYSKDDAEYRLMEDVEYYDKLGELRFWMLYEFARMCPDRPLVSQLIREEVFHDKYALPLFGVIVKERAVHIGDCLHACKDSESMFVAMSAFLNPETCTLPTYCIGGSNPISGCKSRLGVAPSNLISTLRSLTLFDAVQLQDPMRVKNWFDAWASNATEEDALKFMRRFRVNSSIEGANDVMLLIPLAWRENTACARQLIKTDTRVVIAIVDQFVADGNAILNHEELDRLSESGEDTPLEKRAASALQARYESIEKSAIPSFSVLMKACFDGSSIDLADPIIPYNRFEASVFAFAMAAYCDSPEEVKKIVRFHRINFSLRKGTVLSLMPAVVRASIMEDREFLEEFISDNPCEVGRLPANLQYDDKLLELAIANDPTSAAWIDDRTRLLAKPAILEMLLSNDLMVSWAFCSLPTSKKETPSLGCSIISDERLTVQTRRNFYTETLPTVVKHDRKCKLLVARFFGPDLLTMQSDDMDLGDGLTTNLLRIVHESHAASGDSRRSSHSAYLRSLYFDLQTAFMPRAIAERVKHTTVNPGKTYKTTKDDWRPAWDGFDLVQSIAAQPSRETLKHLYRLHEFLDEVSNMVAMVLEPRRRDGLTYPAEWYCEKFEGVLVEYKILETFNVITQTYTPNSTPTLVTKSSGKQVQIPASWRSEMEKAFALGELPLFWGVLHAGYGQRTKATKLKNGTLTSDSDWEGVVIKVYQTTARLAGTEGSYLAPTYTTCSGFFEEQLLRCHSFVELVDHFSFHNYSVSEAEERSILDLHRESRRKGGAGVVFRDKTTPTKLITMDAAGYTLYAQKIIDFLHQYPLHVLSLYMHEAEMLGCDDREEDDEEGDQAAGYPNIHEVIDKVIKQIAPPPLEGKRRAASSSRPSSRAKKQRTTLQGAVSLNPRGAPFAPLAPSAPSAPSPPHESLYGEEDDDEVSEVSDGEVSEVSDEE